MPLIREALNNGRSVRFHPKGTSMLPMLREGKDTVTLSPVPEKLRKFDLPLYQRDNGKYVLHRIIRAEDTYTMMGDNQFIPEPGIRHDQIIGVVTAFSRGQREYPVTYPAYRLYCGVWHASRPLRHLARRVINKLRRMLS